MMSYLVLIGCVAMGLADGRTSADEPPIIAPQKKAPPVRRNASFSGVVTKITPESISIQGIEVEFRDVVSYTTERGVVTYFGNPISFITPTRTIKGVRVVGTNEGYTITDAKGGVVVIRERDQTPRSFRFCKELAEGGAHKGLWPGDSYRIQDVKVGDSIYIRYDRIEGSYTCNQLCICRRPGGLVPPSPDDPGDALGNKYHEWANAHNEWLDNGTPMPDKFLSPRDLAERRAKIAPMPREVKIPRIPDAEP